MRRLLAIANSAAGTADDQAIDAALDVLRREAEVDLVRTASPDDLEQALAEHPDVDGVVVLGGDGSLHAIVAALRSADRLTSTVVGLIPLGSGNDFAATLDLPTDASKAAAVISSGRTQHIDLIIDGHDEVVVNAAHIGIGADAAAVARPWKKALGPLGYPIGAALTGLRGLLQPGARLKIWVDGELLPRQEPVIQVAVGNGRYVGGGAPLLPQADVSDGLLDVSVSYTTSPRRRIAYAFSVRRGDHHQRDDVVYLTATTVTISGDSLRCTSDGELIEPQPEHSWHVEPGAIQMYVP